MPVPGDAGGFKQDMVVSTRYRNDLPPPPLPPKLLDIDTGGLAQYLTTGFASGLVRREELNIEVDAEGGVPIDMIGVPGYFLGDESAIMAPEIQPPVDPADHALLLSPEQIRNRGGTNANVSFLRKTQYMTSREARANDPFLRNPSRTLKSTVAAKPAAPAVSRDDPSYIRKHIQKGFDIAYPSSAITGGIDGDLKALPITTSDRDAWRNPVHPSNPKLKPVGFYPFIPDLPAKSDSDTFISVKFDKPPLPARSHGRRDPRVDVAILHPAKVDEVEKEWKMRKDAHEKNPDLYEDPGRLAYDWDFCVPRVENAGKGESEIVDHIQQKYNIANPDRDDPNLYANTEKGRFEYERIRTFAEDSAPTTSAWRYLAISLFDPADSTSPSTPSRLDHSSQGKAAYYYPIGQRMRLKADRVKTLAQARAYGGQAGKLAAVANENSVDGVDVLIRDPDEDEKYLRGQVRSAIDRRWNESEEMEILRAKMEEREAEEREREREEDEAREGGETVKGDSEDLDADVNGDGDGDVNGDQNGNPKPTRSVPNGIKPFAAIALQHDQRDRDVEMADADADAEGEEE